MGLLMAHGRNDSVPAVSLQMLAMMCEVWSTDEQWCGPRDISGIRVGLA